MESNIKSEVVERREEGRLARAEESKRMWMGLLHTSAREEAVCGGLAMRMQVALKGVLRDRQSNVKYELGGRFPSRLRGGV
jgi:hypothetical protein